MATAQEPVPFEHLWDFNDPAATEARFREELARAGDDSARIQILTQIARTQGLRKLFEEAHRTLDEAEALLGTRDLPEARVRYLLERGRALDSPVHPPGQKRTDEARRFFMEAIDYGQAVGHLGYAVDAAHMLAIIETPDRQLQWGDRAIALAEGSQDERARKWLGPLYNNIGWSYHDLGQHEKALDYFQRSVAFREARGEVGPARIARWTVARCLRSLGRLEEALQRQQALLAEYEAAGEEEVGYASEEVAECLQALGRPEEARPWFARAFQALSRHEAWLLEEEPARMERLRTLGGL